MSNRIDPARMDWFARRSPSEHYRFVMGCDTDRWASQREFWESRRRGLQKIQDLLADNLMTVRSSWTGPAASAHHVKLGQVIRTLGVQIEEATAAALAAEVAEQAIHQAQEKMRRLCPNEPAPQPSPAGQTIVPPGSAERLRQDSVWVTAEVAATLDQALHDIAPDLAAGAAWCAAETRIRTAKQQGGGAPRHSPYQELPSGAARTSAADHRSLHGRHRWSLRSRPGEGESRDSQAAKGRRSGPVLSGCARIAPVPGPSTENSRLPPAIAPTVAQPETPLPATTADNVLPTVPSPVPEDQTEETAAAAVDPSHVVVRITRQDAAAALANLVHASELGTIPYSAPIESLPETIVLSGDERDVDDFLDQAKAWLVPPVSGTGSSNQPARLPSARQVALQTGVRHPAALIGEHLVVEIEPSQVPGSETWQAVGAAVSRELTSALVRTGTDPRGFWLDRNLTARARRSILRRLRIGTVLTVAVGTGVSLAPAAVLLAYPPYPDPVATEWVVSTAFIILALSLVAAGWLHHRRSVGRFLPAVGLSEAATNGAGPPARFAVAYSLPPTDSDRSRHETIETIRHAVTAGADILLVCRRLHRYPRQLAEQLAETLATVQAQHPGRIRILYGTRPGRLDLVNADLVLSPPRALGVVAPSRQHGPFPALIAERDPATLAWVMSRLLGRSDTEITRTVLWWRWHLRVLSVAVASPETVSAISRASFVLAEIMVRWPALVDRLARPTANARVLDVLAGAAMDDHAWSQETLVFGLDHRIEPELRQLLLAVDPMLVATVAPWPTVKNT